MNNPWNVVQEEFDDFLKLIPSLIPNTSNMDCLLEIMTMLLVNQKTIFKLSIDSMEEVMTHIIRNCTFSSKTLQVGEGHTVKMSLNYNLMISEVKTSWIY